MKSLLSIVGWILMWFALSYMTSVDRAFEAYRVSGAEVDLIEMYYYIFYTIFALVVAIMFLWQGKEEKLVVQIEAYAEQDPYATKTHLGADEEDYKA